MDFTVEDQPEVGDVPFTTNALKYLYLTEQEAGVHINFNIFTTIYHMQKE